MNKRELLIQRNRISQLVRPANRLKNVLRWSSGERFNHILMKLMICVYIKAQGEEFISEAIFESGDRCDVLWLDKGVAIEVYSSEGELSKLRKLKVYPVPVIFVNANVEWNEKLIL